MEILEDRSHRQSAEMRVRAALISLIVGATLLVFKFFAYWLTGSIAVLSDAFESIVNIVAAGIALITIRIATKPADREHPYGHGKFEYFSASFEGGLITFAAIIIFIDSLRALFLGPEVQKINEGLLIVIGAGAVNLLLGLYLLRAGKKTSSTALRASGHHIISDFWTSLAVITGLFLVQLTGLKWLDPVTAIVVACHLGYVGVSVVRNSLSGLVDEESLAVLKKLQALFQAHRRTGLIHIHHTRVIRSGEFHHIDAHAVVPEFWDVATAHNFTNEFEKQVIADYPMDGEIHFHVDPCRKAYCRVCDVPDCPIRQKDFERLNPFRLDEIRDPEEPSRFKN